MQAFHPELAERLEHDESGFFTFSLCLLHQALVEQRRDSFKHRGGLVTVRLTRLAHRFGRFKRAAADEDGEPAEEALF